jgi:methyl-accepting chemotaxis protein
MSAKSSLQQRLDFIGLDQHSIAALRALKPLIEAAMGPALTVFYEKVSAVPETRRFFANQAHMTHAKSRQQQHWQVISSGEYSETYERGVKAIGQAHARLGLEPRWFIGGYALIAEQLVHAVVKDQWPSLLKRSTSAEGLAESLSSLMKAVMLDMDIAISVYLETLEEERRRAEATRQALEDQQATAVRALAASLERLAAGDLAARLDIELAAEFGKVKHDFNDAVTKFQATLGAVARSARTIGSGAEELAQASDDMSRRTEQQAASLEETAAALEELTAGVTKSAARARQASETVTGAKDEARQSGEIVAAAIAAMGRIETASGRIAQIIGVIDEIALQTNLLALNAGVEAARAGETGKGFAVIASEVRVLAQRSAEAAKEIGALIRTSSIEVGGGVKLVGDTGKALERIIARVSEIDSCVTEIADSAQHQASGLGQVNTAVNQLNQITQQNAAMAEESTATSHALTGEMRELVRLMAKFRLGEPQALPGVAQELDRGQVIAFPSGSAQDEAC